MPESQDLSQELRTGVSRFYRRYRSLRGENELGDAAIDVLAVLRRYGPLSLKALSDYQRVKPPTMSQTVNRLQAGGHVERRADPDDGRRVLLALTPGGERLVSAVRQRGLTWLDERLAGLEDHERTTLADAARLLQRIAAD